MQVTLHCYGTVRDAVGSDRYTLRLEGTPSVETVLWRLAEEQEEFEVLAATQTLILMREGTHLDQTDRVHDGDVLAISTSPMPE